MYDPLLVLICFLAIHWGLQQRQAILASTGVCASPSDEM
jgi:hypothetical protein